MNRNERKSSLLKKKIKRENREICIFQLILISFLFFFFVLRSLNLMKNLFLWVNFTVSELWELVPISLFTTYIHISIWMFVYIIVFHLHNRIIIPFEFFQRTKKNHFCCSFCFNWILLGTRKKFLFFFFVVCTYIIIFRIVVASPTISRSLKNKHFFFSLFTGSAFVLKVKCISQWRRSKQREKKCAYVFIINSDNNKTF